MEGVFASSRRQRQKHNPYMAPPLERMKKRGFDTQEIAEKLHEKGIEVKAPTLAKYLNEFRRQRGRGKDTLPAPSSPAQVQPQDRQTQETERKPF